MDNESIINSLISLKSDEKYRDFIASLVPTISKEKIIGVKTPAIRSFAKTLFIQLLSYKIIKKDTTKRSKSFAFSKIEILASINLF